MKVPMTVEGELMLREELQHLKFVLRPEIVNAIAEARTHGDLKENAEYHTAKDRQGFIEARIREIEGKLSNAQVIDVTRLPVDDKVVFGARVSLLNLNADQEQCYRIVGEDEADIKSGKISVMSPLARALVGKHAGEEVVVDTPNGKIEYQIVGVEYR